MEWNTKIYNRKKHKISQKAEQKQDKKDFIFKCIFRHRINEIRDNRLFLLVSFRPNLAD
jgi:hypothetical protein